MVSMEQGGSKSVSNQEELLQYLFKTDGLIELMLSKDLATISVSKLYNCLLVAKTLISKAIEINETLLLPKPASVTPLRCKHFSLQKNSGNDIHC